MGISRHVHHHHHHQPIYDHCREKASLMDLHLYRSCAKCDKFIPDACTARATRSQSVEHALCNRHRPSRLSRVRMEVTVRPLDVVIGDLKPLRFRQEPSLGCRRWECLRTVYARNGKRQRTTAFSTPINVYRLSFSYTPFQRALQAAPSPLCVISCGDVLNARDLQLLVKSSGTRG